MLKIIKCLVLLHILILMACAQKKTVKSIQLTSLSVDKPMRLKMRQLKGKQIHSYYFKKKTTTYAENEKTNYKVQELLFDVENKYTKAKKGEISYSMTGLSKSGTIMLNDMGYPEIKETINVTLNSVGGVLFSSKGGVASVWYIAPISLPTEKVSIGETWTYKKTWINPYLNVPLKLNIVSVLEGFYLNKNKEKIAKIIVSGNITMSLKKNKSILYKDEVRGDYLFNVTKGTIEASYINGVERMIISGTRIDSINCIESIYLDIPEKKNTLTRCRH